MPYICSSQGLTYNYNKVSGVTSVWYCVSYIGNYFFAYPCAWFSNISLYKFKSRTFSAIFRTIYVKSYSDDEGHNLGYCYYQVCCCNIFFCRQQLWDIISRSNLVVCLMRLKLEVSYFIDTAIIGFLYLPSLHMC